MELRYHRQEWACLTQGDGDYTAGRGRLDSCSVIGCYSMTSGYAMSRDSV